MNRVAGWRFLDMGRRIERGVNICRFTRTLADDDATIDDLDLLLDLADSQITYRARYLVGLALTPVRDMVMLDPYNTRSLAFQVVTLKDHLAALPALLDDGMLEEPDRDPASSWPPRWRRRTPPPWMPKPCSASSTP